jgi:hypothetical protein
MSLIRVKQIDNEELNSFISIPINVATGELYNIISPQLGGGGGTGGLNQSELTGFLATGNYILNYPDYISTIVSTSIPTGQKLQFVSFGYDFTGIPHVYPSIQYNYDVTGTYIPFSSGVTTSGAYIGYSSNITETGLKINLLVQDTRYTGGYNFIFNNQYITTGQDGLDINSLNSYLGTGQYNLKDSVRTTGNQIISGEKTFIDKINGSSGLFKYVSGDNLIYNTGYFQTINGELEVKSNLWSQLQFNCNGNIYLGKSLYGGGNGSISLPTGGLIYSSSNWTISSVLGLRLQIENNAVKRLGINVGSGVLYTGVSRNIVLNWDSLILSGDWSTNTIPTQAGHITNKKYVDEQITGLSGYLINNTSSSEKVNYSYYFDYTFTGLSIAETFVHSNAVITGYKIGCIETGRGPAHLNSGASGILVWSPLTGRFYQRTTANNKIFGGNFGINSGELFISKPISYNVTGDNRFGLDLISGLSGLYGLSISLLGYTN